jgi:hypothetical protein
LRQPAASQTRNVRTDSFRTNGRILAGIDGLLGSLTYCRTTGMVFHMKTTLNIDDRLMARLKQEAMR